MSTLYDPCPDCDGRGEYEIHRLQKNGEYGEDVPAICGECGGSGRVERETYGEHLAYMEGVD